jgi:hypothetical protein
MASLRVPGDAAPKRVSKLEDIEAVPPGAFTDTVQPPPLVSSIVTVPAPVRLRRSSALVMCPGIVPAIVSDEIATVNIVSEPAKVVTEPLVAGTIVPEKDRSPTTE